MHANKVKEFNPDAIATDVEIREQLMYVEPDNVTNIDLGLRYGQRSFQMVDGDGIQGCAGTRETTADCR